MLLRQSIIRRRRNGQQQATLADHGVGIFQRLTAHIIQHEVDILDLGGKILTAIVDDFIGAEGFDERDVRGGTRGNNIQAGKLGELNGKSADAAGAGMNKHPLTRRGPGGVNNNVQAVPAAIGRAAACCSGMLLGAGPTASVFAAANSA